MQFPKFIKQTFVLVISQVVVIAAGFGIKTLQTRYLGPELYGEYAFFASLTGFLVLFYRFGFFSSLQLLLTEAKEEIQVKKLQAAGLILAIINGVVFSVSLFLLADLINVWFSTSIGNYLQVLAPLLAVIPFKHFVYAVSVGTNRTHLMAIFDGASKVLFLLGLLGLIEIHAFNLKYVLIFNLASTLALILYIITQLKYNFNQLGYSIQNVFQKTKGYGFNMYLGFTANQGTYKLDEMLITLFSGTLINGFYTLASILCSPITMFSQSLSNVLFKQFHVQDKIPSKIFIINTLAAVSYLIALIFLSDFVVELLFGEAYSQVSTYLIPLSFAFLFQALYQPYMFLASKGKGKTIRNIAFTEAGINLIGNLVFIPIFGVFGAIYTSIVAKATHFILKYLAYRAYTKNV